MKKTKTKTDIVDRLREATVPRLEMGWPAPHVVQRKEPLWMEAAEEIRQNRMKLAAIEAMGYEWRWTKSIDENEEQVGAWVMRREEGGA